MKFLLIFMSTLSSTLIQQGVKGYFTSSRVALHSPVKAHIKSAHIKRTQFSTSTVLYSKKNKNVNINPIIKVAAPHPIYLPKTENQKKYYEFLQNPDINVVICAGPAGSGKTALVCQYAIERLKAGEYKRIVITRPLVSVEEDIGFLPGNLQKKMEPWTRPMLDIFGEFYSTYAIDEMIQTGIIEISPLGLMRGRTFKDAVIIADEMQNSSPNQMLMVATRIGDGSKLVITGDLNQTDTEKNGLKDLIGRVRSGAAKTPEIQLVEFSAQDIVRHPIVSKILRLYAPVAVPVPVILEKNPMWITSEIDPRDHNTDCAIIPRHLFKE
jgi:phosphate starvation-inducible PhoH-like protein